MVISNAQMPLDRFKIGNEWASNATKKNEIYPRTINKKARNFFHTQLLF